MENKEEKSTTVQEKWMGQTPQTDNEDNQEKIVVKECSCVFN